MGVARGIGNSLVGGFTRQSSRGGPPQETQPDLTDARLSALRFEETQRRLRESRGRRASFLFSDQAAGGISGGLNS